MSTPRTDAQGYGDGRHPYVPTEFARQLERELAAERALADRLAGMIEALPAYIKATGRFGEALAAWKGQRKNQTDDDQARDPA